MIANEEEFEKAIGAIRNWDGPVIILDSLSSKEGVKTVEEFRKAREAFEKTGIADITFLGALSGKSDRAIKLAAAQASHAARFPIPSIFNQAVHTTDYVPKDDRVTDVIDRMVDLFKDAVTLKPITIVPQRVLTTCYGFLHTALDEMPFDDSYRDREYRASKSVYPSPEQIREVPGERGKPNSKQLKKNRMKEKRRRKTRSFQRNH